jgi:hypothetical protein
LFSGLIYYTFISVLQRLLRSHHTICYYSNEYTLTAIVLDIADQRIFKPVDIKKDEIDKRYFLKLLCQQRMTLTWAISFITNQSNLYITHLFQFCRDYLDLTIQFVIINCGHLNLKINYKTRGVNIEDDINLGNIIHHKSVKSKIPPYFKDQSVPLISYVYIRPIASKMFNYKHVLLHHNIDEFNYKPPDYLSPPFKFYPLSGIILDRIHKYFKVVFPVYGFRLTIFRSFGEPPIITCCVLSILTISNLSFLFPTVQFPINI